MMNSKEISPPYLDTNGGLLTNRNIIVSTLHIQNCEVQRGEKVQ